MLRVFVNWAKTVLPALAMAQCCLKNALKVLSSEMDSVEIRLIR